LNRLVQNCFYLHRELCVNGAHVRVEGVLFDLFNTLVIVDHDDEFYLPSLKKLHRSLVRKGIEVSFEDSMKAYFQVRNRLYADAEKNMEEPELLRVLEYC
jgi:hypothetical protein